jgi:uncharacterized Fe-S cluster-containing radical SAM superfamily protein
MPLDTIALAAKYRAATIRLNSRELLITNFRNSEQEHDLTEPANCENFGRIKHFRRATSNGWPSNPLPIDPACNALGLGKLDEIRAQVFQNAACNWRCWYCFVPFNLLSADITRSAWLTPEELVDRFLNEANRARMLDLSGGQPELVPEWVLWTMEALERRGVEDEVYLWSDDNLSCDHFWRFLTVEQQEFVGSYRNYGRVACFKGFDEQSFAFNSSAESSWFDRQFELMSRWVSSGIDMYSYVTLTTPEAASIADGLPRFVDRLQEIHENLPLRTIPLEIQNFTPMTSRVDEGRRAAMQNQWRAIEVWQRELQDRFPSSQREVRITDVAIGTRNLARQRCRG